MNIKTITLGIALALIGSAHSFTGEIPRLELGPMESVVTTQTVSGSMATREVKFNSANSSTVLWSGSFEDTWGCPIGDPIAARRNGNILTVALLQIDIMLYLLRYNLSTGEIILKPIGIGKFMRKFSLDAGDITVTDNGGIYFSKRSGAGGDLFEFVGGKSWRLNGQPYTGQ